MAFINDDMAIIFHQIIDCALVDQALDHRNIYRSGNFMFPTPDLSDILFPQP